MVRRRLFLSILALLFTLGGLAGCGGSSQPHVARHPVSKPALTRVCPTGHSAMGCASRLLPHKPSLGKVGAPSGALFPDVYEGQGAVNWGAVKAWQNAHGWQAAAIFKLGEYRIDGEASRNASETARLGFWRAGYWFVRATGCSNEAGQIIAAGRSFGLKVLVLDTEVPEAAGYVGCLAPSIQRAGFIVVVYTAPGTWPGGANYNLPLWVATFGSGFGCVWTCHPVAWQFTDGSFGSPTFIPGIGTDDVNVDYGITRLGAAPVDPLHRAWYSTGPFKSPFGNLNERLIVQQYDGARQHPAKYAAYLKHLEGELRYLAGRVSFVSHHPLAHGKPTWDLYHRGWRYQQLIHRAQGKKFL